MALEAGSSTLAITRILNPHVARVVVANTKKLRQISHAKCKTDMLGISHEGLGALLREEGI